MTTEHSPQKFFCVFHPCLFQTDDEDEARGHYMVNHFPRIENWHNFRPTFNKWTKEIFSYQFKLSESMSKSPPHLPVLPYQKKPAALFFGCPVCEQIIRFYNVSPTTHGRIEMKKLTDLDYSQQRGHCNKHLQHTPITCKYNKLDDRICTKAVYTYREFDKHFKEDHDEEDLDEVKKFIKDTEIKDIDELLLRHHIKPDRWPNKRCTDGPDSTSKRKKTPQKTPPADQPVNNRNSETDVSANLFQPSTSAGPSATVSRSPQKLITDYMLNTNQQTIPSISTTVVNGSSENNGEENGQQENIINRVVPMPILISSERIPKEELLPSETSMREPVEWRLEEESNEFVSDEEASAAEESDSENSSNQDGNLNCGEQEQNSLPVKVPLNQLPEPQDMSVTRSTSTADESRDQIDQVNLTRNVRITPENNAHENDGTSSRVDFVPPALSEAVDLSTVNPNNSSTQRQQNESSSVDITGFYVKEIIELLEINSFFQDTGNFFCIFCPRQFRSRREAVVHYSNHLDLHLRCVHCDQKFVDTTETDAFDAFEAHFDERKSLANDKEYEVSTKWINRFLDSQSVGIEQDYRRQDFCQVCYWINYHKMVGHNQTNDSNESIVEHVHLHLRYQPHYECRRCRLNSHWEQVRCFYRGEEQQAIDHLREKHQKIYQQIDFDSSAANFEKKGQIPKLDKLIERCKKFSDDISDISYLE